MERLPVARAPPGLQEGLWTAPAYVMEAANGVPKLPNGEVFKTTMPSPEFATQYGLPIPNPAQGEPMPDPATMLQTMLTTYSYNQGNDHKLPHAV